ncbi:MAG: hypothetical protein IJL91_07015 [Bacteroidales bacterium]|nr:hypothetical protein [Bacteroidales bacterium]
MEKDIVIENATGLNGTEQESIYRSVRTISETPLGSAPFHRSIGVEDTVPKSLSAVDRNSFASGIIQAVPMWDERISVSEVTVTKEHTAKVVVKYA